VARLRKKVSVWSQADTEKGFTLLETVVAMFISTIVIGVMLRFILSAFAGETLLASREERDAMLGNVRRVLAADAHGAVKESVWSDTLQLTMADGTTYRYELSQRDQLVRVQAGGGTAVLAAHILSVQFVVQSAFVNVQLQTEDGLIEKDSFATLNGLRDMSL